MAENQSASPWNWIWKVLAAILVPLAALIAKDVYDLSKASLTAQAPVEQAKGRTEKPEDPPQAVLPGVLLERVKSRVATAADDARVPTANGVIHPPPALIVAARNGQIRLARLLLGRGADVNGRDKDTDATPLIVAAGAGHLQLVQLFLENGADLNAIDKSGKTAISAAQEYKHEDIVALLKAQASGKGTPAPATP